MNLPDQTPKLPKWPFLVGDAALLAAAGLIAENAAQPLPIEAIAAIVACVICAAIAGAIPFLADYARRQDEALDTRQRSLEALARNATAAADQISIAAAGLRETADSAQRSLGEAEQLPRKLQEQIAEFGAQVARNRAEDKKALEKEMTALRSAMADRLEAVVDKILRQKVDEASTPRFLEERGGTPRLPSTAADSVSRTAPVDIKKEPVPEPAPEPEAPAPTPPPAEAPEGTPKPPRKRAPKKIVVEEAPKLELEEPAPAPSEFTQSSPEEVSPASSIAADGASRLLVTAYIGIGNRLFIRGEGPGLSWEKGVPLQFVSIGKWRWDTNEATAPIAFKLYKNDEIECSALGTGTLEPGHQQEVTAAF